MRPIWKFSSFFESNVQYQCYQKCIPVVQSQPQMLVDLCNKICPHNPTMPDCAKCPMILSQTAPTMTIDEITRRLDKAEPEIIVIEPQSHAIFFRPEVMVVGQERKQCCYMDQCETVPLHTTCESRCYEPCDAVCTGRCRLNPQCPNQCEIVKLDLYKVQYKMWLATRLNEIKRKYRAMATACLLKTRLAFVEEVHGVQAQTPTFLGDELSVVKQQIVPNQIVHQQVVHHQHAPGQIVKQQVVPEPIVHHPNFPGPYVQQQVIPDTIVHYPVFPDEIGQPQVFPGQIVQQQVFPGQVLTQLKDENDEPENDGNSAEIDDDDDKNLNYYNSDQEDSHDNPESSNTDQRK